MRMGVQALELRERDGNRTEGTQACRRELLHRDALDEVEHRQAAMGPRVAVCRQHVVGSGAIITERLRRPCAEEDGARVVYLRQPAMWLTDFEDQVLRRVLVRELDGDVEIRHDDTAARRERLVQDRAPGQLSKLSLDRSNRGERERAARGEQ